MDEKEHYRLIFDTFLKAIPTNVAEFNSQRDTIRLPIISPGDLNDICYSAGKLFKDERSLIRIDPPVTIVGDLHGHIMDLFYILSNFGLPPLKKYLFLGDLVDRGEFSIECVTMVFLLKILYPEQVFLIRGNHEFYYQCSQGGFVEQLQSFYNDPSIIEGFISVFNYLPLGALIANTFICVHGGIGPMVTYLESIDSIQRPINEFGNDIVDSLCWSDPSENVIGYQASNRGLGYLFGKDIMDKFHSKNQTKICIRGHECVMDGFLPQFDDTILTVFSASNYCGLMENKGSVLEICDHFSYEPKQWGPLPYLLRTDVCFMCPHNESSLRRVLKVSQSTKVLPYYAGIDEQEEAAQSQSQTQKQSVSPVVRVPDKATLSSNRIHPIVIAAQQRAVCASGGLPSIKRRNKLKKNASLSGMRFTNAINFR